MSYWLDVYRVQGVQRLRTGRAWLMSRLRRAWRWLRRRFRRVRVQALVADPRHRAEVEADVRQGLRRLDQALDGLPDHLAVIVQHSLATDRQWAGCYQVGQRPDGQPFALVRLALHVDGRALSRDELLAALAEQCIGLSLLHNGAASVVVPIDLDPPRPVAIPATLTAHLDPLAMPNGSVASPPARR